jgi:GDP-L-fucose synthase
MNEKSRIFVAGHRGLVGSAIVRKLHAAGHENVVTRSRAELDLTDQAAVQAFFRRERPEAVFLAAARVGGILANATYQADFLYENLAIATNVIHAAAEHGTEKLLFLGSSCIFPREAPQPMREEALLTSQLEPTNEPYAIAKIAGIKLCESYRRQYGCDFISAMPTNLYGPHDNFDLASSHVLPALMRKFHEARLSGERRVSVWGSGAPRRELLHVDDLADACVFLMRHYSDARHINVGTGEDLTIRELAEHVRDVVYPEACLHFDTSKPDGTPRKLLDVTRLRALGWRHRIELREGIASTYAWFLANQRTASKTQRSTPFTRDQRVPETKAS